MSMRTNLRIWLAVAVFLLAIATATNAKTIYVDADANDGGGGTTWTDAYKYLQDGLADADISAKPVEIRVAQGTYIPDSNSVDPNGSGDRTATFQLINDVNLMGGYAGFGEADPNARDVDLYETILSGDLDGNDANVSNPADLLDEPTRAENSYHIVTGSGTDANAVLDGFTITAGNANETVSPNKSGAGMYSTNSNSPTVLNCTFTANSASNAGGISRWDDLDRTSMVTNCTFSGNFATALGGGIYGERMALTDCTFSGNVAGSEGGMCSYGNSAFINCTFTDNSGGGLGVYGNPAILTNCTFRGNTGYSFGGLDIYGWCNATLTNCVFIGNSATGSYGGGGVFETLFIGYASKFINCIFSGNIANGDGGGYNTTHDFVEFINCTFSENSAGGDGGAFCISNRGGTADFNNCIFWGNTANGEGPQIAIKTSSATVGVNYSDVQGGEQDVYDITGGPALDWGTGNIKVDPCFVDADGADDTVGTEDDNLRLLTDSNCIDAGDNTAVPADTTDLDGDANTTEPVPYDLDGNPRFIDDLCTTDTGNGTAPVVDMGAYEFLRSDIDSDGDVNFKDFGQFALYWLDVACGVCGGADLTCDGDVNAYDLKELADNWLW